MRAGGAVAALLSAGARGLEDPDLTGSSSMSVVSYCPYFSCEEVPSSCGTNDVYHQNPPQSSSMLLIYDAVGVEVKSNDNKRSVKIGRAKLHFRIFFRLAP